MKIVATIRKNANGHWFRAFGAFCPDGTMDVAVTHTLLDLVEEAGSLVETQLLNFMDYNFSNDGQRSLGLMGADFCINDKFVWIGPPKTEIGKIAISNENIETLSDGFGGCTIFTEPQLRKAFDLWTGFLQELKEVGNEGLEGKEYSTEI